MNTQMKFEQGYQKKGLAFQRRYPNEYLLGFLGSNYFHLTPEMRGEVKILDLGCGSGANLWAIAREGFKAHGLDGAPTAIELCQQVLAYWQVSAELRVGDFTSLPYRDAEFDAVVDVISLTHINFLDHLMAWREVFRCLKVGGQFFSWHPGENSLALKSNPTMVDHCTVENVSPGYPLADNGNMCFLSANEVRRSLTEIGFSKIIIEKVTRTYLNQTQLMEFLVIEAEKP